MIRRIIALCLLGLASGVMATARANDILKPPEAGLINEGARALDRGEVRKGFRLTEKALDSLSLGPRDRAVGYNNLCVAYNNMRRYDEALKNCEDAIRLYSRDWRFFNNRGTANFGLGHLESAISDFERALQLAPHAVTLKRNMALALKRRGDPLGEYEQYLH